MNTSNKTNQTDVLEPYIRWHEPDWLIPIIINAILILMTSWILFSLVHFGIKTGKWSKMHKRNSDKLSSGIVYTSTIICAVMSLVRYVISQLVFNIGIGEGHDEVCEILSDTSFVIYCLVILSVYIFLWLRQGIFYSNHMLHTDLSNTIRVFSGSSIVIVFLAGLGVILVNSIPVTYPSSRTGCIYVPTNDVVETISWVASVVVLLFGQITLVGLFIYPLQRNLTWRKRVCALCLCCTSKTMQNDASKAEAATACQSQGRHPVSKQAPDVIADVIKTKVENDVTENTNNSNSTQNQKANEKSKAEKRRAQSRKTSKVVERILRRTIVFSVTTVVTDIVLLLFATYALGNTANRRVTTVIYDVNVFLNLMFVIGSFLSYKGMLTSPLNIRTNDVVTTLSSSV